MCSGFKCVAQYYYVLVNVLSPKISIVTLSLCYYGSTSCQPSTDIIHLSAQYAYTYSCQHGLITCC